MSIWTPGGKDLRVLLRDTRRPSFYYPCPLIFILCSA